jgi:hypothetical protein
MIEKKIESGMPAVNQTKWSFCRSADAKTTFMPRLGKKNRLARIPSAPKTRTLHSRPPLYRFQEIFHAIKTGRYPNRTKLAETIEVTTKTIQRDIDYMRYQMSVPIEFDFAKGGYYFTKPITDLPLFQLTEAELVSIFVAQCESADPGVSRWEPRTHFNPEFFGGDHPLDPFLGEKL